MTKRTSICKECVHIGEFALKVIEDGVCNTTRRSPVCKCIDNAARNYVTGDFVNSFCEDVNRYGECRYFNYIHPDVPNIYFEKTVTGILVVMSYNNYKENDEIYYTTTNEEPGPTWTLYTGPFDVAPDESVTFRAFVYRPSTKEYSEIASNEIVVE